jgi:hypothetical protein
MVFSLVSKLSMQWLSSKWSPIERLKRLLWNGLRLRRASESEELPEKVRLEKGWN